MYGTLHVGRFFASRDRQVGPRSIQLSVAAWLRRFGGRVGSRSVLYRHELRHGRVQLRAGTDLMATVRLAAGARTCRQQSDWAMTAEGMAWAVLVIASVDVKL